MRYHVGGVYETHKSLNWFCSKSIRMEDITLGKQSEGAGTIADQPVERFGPLTNQIMQLLAGFLDPLHP